MSVPVFRPEVNGEYFSDPFINLSVEQADSDKETLALRMYGLTGIRKKGDRTDNNDTMRRLTKFVPFGSDPTNELMM